MQKQSLGAFNSLYIMLNYMSKCELRAYRQVSTQQYIFYKIYCIYQRDHTTNEQQKLINNVTFFSIRYGILIHLAMNNYFMHILCCPFCVKMTARTMYQMKIYSMESLAGCSCRSLLSLCKCPGADLHKGAHSGAPRSAFILSLLTPPVQKVMDPLLSTLITSCTKKCSIKFIISVID